MRITNPFASLIDPQAPALGARPRPAAGPSAARPAPGDRIGPRRRPLPAESDDPSKANEALDRPFAATLDAGAPYRAQSVREGTGWPLRAPAVTRKLDEVRFDEARVDERGHELAALSLPAQEAGGLRVSQAPLAAYLAARAIDGRHVDGEDLTRLRNGHAAVVDTRRVLSGGRGNVKQDIQATNHESTRRMFVGRALVDKMAEMRGDPSPSIEEGVAAAEFVRAGNCNEFAQVAVHRAAGRLAAADRLHKVKATGVDHAFAEMRSAKGRDHDVVIDAWAKGPAILAPDGRFSGGTERPSSTFSIDAASAKTFVRAVRDQRELLELNAVGYVDHGLSVERAQGRTLEPNAVFAETPAIDETFARRVAKKMDAAVDLRGRIAEPPTLQDKRVELRQEIHAAGAVRALGHGVKEAAENAPSVAAAARRLAD